MNLDWRESFAAAYPDLHDLTSGREHEFGFAIKAIRMIGGETVPLQEAGVTAIVGANNAGKSTLLRETSEKLAHVPGFPEQPRIAVEGFEIISRGGRPDVIAWLGGHSSFVVQGSNAGFQSSQMGIQHPTRLLEAWNESVSELGALASSIVFYGNAQGRFSIGGAAEMRENAEDPPQHPVHYLQDSKNLLDDLSAITRDVFGVPLTLDTLGRTLRLRVGEVGMDAPAIDNVPTEYRRRMASLRQLDEQGDGMRSMMGQLIPVITAAYKLIILDEPEAFLHPPQAHALGVQLGQLASLQKVQIILATHDRNLLTGLLDSGVEVSVVRLNRSDGHARASQLDHNQLKALWTDPVLKYTNVLDGLFHRLVVVAEAEGDCAYLSAALDSEKGVKRSIPRNEILLVPTGGKDGMAKVCAALSAVNVPVVAAPDLDMLSDKGKLINLVGSLGGSWTEQLERLWKLTTADLAAPKGHAKVGHVLDAIANALDPNRDQLYSSSFREIVLAQLRTSESPWNAIKDHGMSAFKGEARQAAGELVRLLNSLGVVLVEVGELERLAPEIAVRKGPGWLQAALMADQQSNSATQEHINRILIAGEQRMEKAR